MSAWSPRPPGLPECLTWVLLAPQRGSGHTQCRLPSLPGSKLVCLPRPGEHTSHLRPWVLVLRPAHGKASLGQREGSLPGVQALSSPMKASASSPLRTPWSCHGGVCVHVPHGLTSRVHVKGAVSQQQSRGSWGERAQGLLLQRGSCHVPLCQQWLHGLRSKGDNEDETTSSRTAVAEGEGEAHVRPQAGRALDLKRNRTHPRLCSTCLSVFTSVLDNGLWKLMLSFTQ